MRTSSCVYLHPDEILAQPDFYLHIYLKYNISSGQGSLLQNRLELWLPPQQPCSRPCTCCIRRSFDCTQHNCWSHLCQGLDAAARKAPV